MIHAFLYGVILAFGLIVPLGVQNIFVFNQGAAQKHFLHALPSILTASICDALLILCAVLGVSVVVLTIPWLKTLIFAFGFFFLIYMGWMTWRTKPAISQKQATPLSAKNQILFSASVSLLNPHALLDTVGVIGTSSLNFIGGEKIAYTFACILVSASWFFTLSILGHFLHKLDTAGTWIRLINKGSALIIWGIAIYIAYQLLVIYLCSVSAMLLS